MTKRQRVLGLMRADPGLTSEELRLRLLGPNGTVSPYRPDPIRADPPAQGLIVGNDDSPRRRFPVSIIDRNMTDGSVVVVREWRA